MIRIAVLDDDRESGSRIKNDIEKELIRRKTGYETVAYKSPMELLADLDDGKYYDLFFLDVEMRGMNGVETAGEIRKYYMEPVIVYVTNYIRYSVQAFEVNAFRYILKPEWEEKLPKALDAIIPEIEAQGQQSYVIRHYNDMEILSYSDIYYIEKNGKYAFLHHRKGVSSVRKSLGDLLNELASPDFIPMGRSLAVNIRHIEKIRQQEIELRNGEILTMNKYRCTLMKEKVLKRWAQIK